MAAAPNVYVVCGSESFLRRRFLKQFLDVQAQSGYVIEQVDAAVKMGVEDALDTAGMFGGKQMFVVCNPDKGNTVLYDEHLKAGTKGAPELVLHYEGDPKANTKFAKFVEAHPKIVRQFTAPPPYKAAEVATQFLVAEARTHGKKITPELAAEVVLRAGSDLGFLAYEAKKMALLADADGVDDLDPIRIKGALAELSEAALGPVEDALGAKDIKGLTRALARVGKTHKDDPTIRVVRMLGRTVRLWYQVMSLPGDPRQGGG